MDITLGNVLAALIPTVGIALVGWLLNRSVGDVDRRVQTVEAGQESIERKVEGLKDELKNDIAKVHSRVSKTEVEQAKTQTKLDAHLEWHESE